MTAKILDGKKLNTELASELAQEISTLMAGKDGKKGIQPKLVIIQVGDHPESNTYIKNKKLLGEKIGTIVEHIKYTTDTTQDKIISDILQHSEDVLVHGIIVQMPLPAGFDAMAVIDAIDPSKDVDGMTSRNVRLLYENKKGFLPATTKGILTLLEKYEINPVGKKVVVVGHSVLVGKPTALAMLNLGATVTVCHSQTKNLETETRQADILIVAVGRPDLITKDFVKEDQVVIDIGISVVQQGEGASAIKKIHGDVDFENVKEIVAAITPVPGGVGPMTNISLFQNLLEACR